MSFIEITPKFIFYWCIPILPWGEAVNAWLYGICVSNSKTSHSMSPYPHSAVKHEAPTTPFLPCITRHQTHSDTSSMILVLIFLLTQVVRNSLPSTNKARNPLLLASRSALRMLSMLKVVSAHFLTTTTLLALRWADMFVYTSQLIPPVIFFIISIKY